MPIKQLILLAFITFSSCISNEVKETGVIGHLQDKQGNPLNDVSITRNLWNGYV